MDIETAKTTTINVTMFPDGRMDLENTAVYIGISERSLATLKREGKGPEGVKIGGQKFHFREDVDKWIQSRKK